MSQLGPNDALSQNFMKLGLLVADKNVDTQTNRQDSCFLSIYEEGHLELSCRAEGTGSVHAVLVEHCESSFEPPPKKASGNPVSFRPSYPAKGKTTDNHIFWIIPKDVLNRDVK